MRAQLFAAVICLLLGCESEGRAVLVVELRTDFVLGEELDTLELSTVSGPSVLSTRERPRGDDALGGVRLAELEGIVPGTYRLSFTGWRPDGTFLARTDVIVDVAGTSVVRALLTRSCTGVTCDEGDSLVACIGGGCEDPRCVAGQREECRGPPECERASDCGSSDPACGDRTCVDGWCVVDTEDACAPGEYCVPESGCQSRGAVMDAGTDAGLPDAGEPADGGETCDDHIRNGDESDEDCGGSACPPCDGGAACRVGGDCTSGVCLGETCTDPALVGIDFTAPPGDRAADTGAAGFGLELFSTGSPDVEWRDDGAFVRDGAYLQSTAVVEGLRDALVAADELTVELWITPAQTEFDYQARLVTLERPTSTDVGFTVAHGPGPTVPSPSLFFRLRTTDAPDVQGLPALVDPVGVTSTGRRMHVVIVRAVDGEERIYVDGEARVTGARTGSFDEWPTNLVLRVGNSESGIRGWHGTFHYLGVYDRAVAEEEVGIRFSLGGP